MKLKVNPNRLLKGSIINLRPWDCVFVCNDQWSQVSSATNKPRQRSISDGSPQWSQYVLVPPKNPNFRVWLDTPWTQFDYLFCYLSVPFCCCFGELFRAKCCNRQLVLIGLSQFHRAITPKHKLCVFDIYRTAVERWVCGGPVVLVGPLVRTC